MTSDTVFFVIPADHKRQRQGRAEEEGRNGSTQEREDHGSDVRDAEALHQWEQRTVPTKSRGAGGLHICCCKFQVHTHEDTHPLLLQDFVDVSCKCQHTDLNNSLLPLSVFFPPPVLQVQSHPLFHRCVLVRGGWVQQTGENWWPVFFVRRNRRSEVKAEQWCWRHLSRDPQFYPKTANATCLTQVGGASWCHQSRTQSVLVLI